jgi:hypothetical protein
MLQGTKTKYFEDVKLPVYAGMDFKTKNNRMRKVGFEVFRHYYDTPEKDFQVGSERVKRVINGN